MCLGSSLSLSGCPTLPSQRPAPQSHLGNRQVARAELLSVGDQGSVQNSDHRGPECQGQPLGLSVTVRELVW